MGEEASELEVGRQNLKEENYYLVSTKCWVLCWAQ